MPPRLPSPSLLLYGPHTRTISVTLLDMSEERNFEHLAAIARGALGAATEAAPAPPAMRDVAASKTSPRRKVDKASNDGTPLPFHSPALNLQQRLQPDAFMQRVLFRRPVGRDQRVRLKLLQRVI